MLTNVHRCSDYTFTSRLHLVTWIVYTHWRAFAACLLRIYLKPGQLLLLPIYLGYHDSVIRYDSNSIQVRLLGSNPANNDTRVFL